MARKLTIEQKNAIVEGLKVFAWAGLSAVLPLLIAYLENDPRWVALVPVVNAIAYSIKTELKNREIIK